MLVMGEINKLHGIKGGFTLILYNHESRFLKNGEQIYLKTNQDEKSFNIRDISYGNKVILYLEGINNIEEASIWIPCKLLIDESKLPKLDGEYYVKDLIGKKVYTLNHLFLGHVDEVYSNSSNFVLVVGGLDIPMTTDFIIKIDESIIVKKPEYI